MDDSLFSTGGTALTLLGSVFVIAGTAFLVVRSNKNTEREILQGLVVVAFGMSMVLAF